MCQGKGYAPDEDFAFLQHISVQQRHFTGLNGLLQSGVKSGHPHLFGALSGLMPCSLSVCVKGYIRLSCMLSNYHLI